MIKKGWFTTQEIADLLGVHQRTVQRWLVAGYLHGHRFGNVWRIPAQSFERFLNVTSNISVSDGYDPEQQLRFVVEMVQDEHEE